MELAGRVLGEFVVREKIGAGGFGEVYRAEQPVLEREAVVKVARAVDGDESVRRFLREAQLASRIDHPFAAHIYAFGAEADGLLWIAMELVRGITLDRLLAEQGPLPLDRFLPFFERLCEVVHDAHQQGIVHRDIKPKNVMVMNRSGRLLPKLLDLGIAKLADGEHELAERVVGSPHYMPPEQWRDARSVDRRTDVYALAVVAFESLTGRRPFDGADLAAIASAHASAPVPPLGPPLPAELDAVLARGLAKAPDWRPDTALALAQGLRAAAGEASAIESLPELEPALRESWTAHAPQPLAEAVAALEAARNPHQAWEAAGALAGTIVRWLGTLALACRSRAAVAAGEEAHELLLQLRRRGLDEAGWIALARELVRPLTGASAAQPVPGLIGFLAGGERRLVDHALVLTRPAPPGEDLLLAQLATAIAALERLMHALGFLLDHPLAVIRGARGERWIGLRRKRRVSLPLAGRAAAPEGTAVLLDSGGAAVLSLAPLVQIASPAPGADDECFLFDGPGPLGARLVAWPHGFERQDEAVWSWFGARLVGAEGEERPASLSVRAPWPGLAAFTGADAAIFCGREREVEAFANRLRAQPLLAVVGPSGAGKSSFVQAGVLPALPSWSAVILRPGPAPVAALSARLAKAGVLAAEGAGVGDALRAFAEERGPVVLVVDQFEELFTLCRDPGERRAFAAALAGAARTADDPVRVVVTLRDDFLVRAERIGALRDRLAHGLAVLATPAREDLRRILVEPARRAGYEFDDPELPDRMVDEVAGTEGALALLSFTAAKLWELRDRHFRQLLARAYDSLGGVGGALARHAEATLAGLTAAEQRLARDAFRHLVTADGTRAVLGHDELVAMLGGQGARGVVDRLVAARLLTAAEGETGEDRIEIVHEALLAAWPRLVDWRREDAEGARFRDQIRSAAEQWAARGRPRGLLWRDDALAEYRLWRTRFPGALPSVAEEFARASLGAAARRRRTRTLAVAALVAVLAGGVLVLYRAGRREEAERRRAEDRLVQFYEEQGRQALLAGSSLHALVYLTEAYRRGADSAALRVSLADASRPLEAELVRLPGHTGRVWSADFDPAGGRIVTAADDGVARLFRADGTAERGLAGHLGRITRARFAAGGRQVVTAAVDGTARLFDAATGAQLAVFEAGGEVFDAALSPDGRTLATGAWMRDSAEPFRLWDAASERLRCAAGERGTLVTAVAFAPGSDRVAAAGSDGSVRVLDTADCRERAIVRHAEHVQHVAFSPGGDAILSASWDATAAISDPATGETRAVLAGHSDKVEYASFSPDGLRVATASRDGTARIWLRATGRAEAVLVGHTGPLNQATFDAGGARVVTASSDGTARIWDARSGRQLASLEGHGGVLLTAAFAPDGRRIVTSSWDGTARVWDAGEPAALARVLAPAAAGATRFAIDAARGRVAIGRGAAAEVHRVSDGALLVRVAPGGAEVVALALSADGERLVTLDRAGSARVFELASGRRLSAVARVIMLDPRGAMLADGGDETLLVGDLGQVHERLPDSLSTMALGAGGHAVLGAASGQVALWDLAAHRTSVAARGHASAVEYIALAPGGERIATAGGDDQVHLWSGGLAPIAALERHGHIRDLAFDGGGRRLLTASDDGVARVWDARGGRMLAALEGHADFLNAVALSGDDQLIATGSGDGTIRLWDASGYRMIGVRDARGGFVFDVAFSGDGERVLSLDASGALLSWDVHRERRTPDQMAELVACRVPFRLDVASGRVLPISPVDTPDRCRP